MVDTIEPGYMGVAEIGGFSVRCTDFSGDVNQEFGFYNHVIGLNDTTPADSKTKDEAIGVIQPQRTFVKPNPLSIEGTMSFPATENNLSFFFDSIKYGTYIDEFTFYYYCRESRKFLDSRLSTFSLEITAGEILNITVGFVSKEIEDAAGLKAYSTAEKLITWDQVDITINDADFSSNDLLKGFTLDVTNPIEMIYTLLPSNNMSDLAPHDLRIGMQEVSGVVTFYLRDGLDILPDCVDPAAASTIDLDIPGLNETLNVLFLPRKTSGVTNAVASTIGFVGIDKALGD